MSMYPENKDVDFAWEEFQNKINNDLNDTIGNFVHRTLTFANNFCNGEAPKPDAFTDADKEIIKHIEEYPGKVGKLLDEMKLRQALNEVLVLARNGNQYLNAEEPWKNKDRKNNVIYLCLSIVKSLSVALEPFIPESANKIKEILNEQNLHWEDAGKLIEVGKKVNKPIPLFKKVEDEKIPEYKKMFEGKKKIEGVKDVSEIVSYEEFKKMKLKVAQIKEVEEVEGADKLYKLSIDIGEDRTLVAGLKEYYTAEELKGKQIVVLSNLQPRKMRGIESQGMLLAAEKDGVVSLLTVDRALPNGADVE